MNTVFLMNILVISFISLYDPIISKALEQNSQKLMDSQKLELNCSSEQRMSNFEWIEESLV